jgi:hypothetical protein
MNDNLTSVELSDRIADVLAGEASVDEVTEVITSAEHERDHLNAEREKARAVAFDPLTKSDVVEAARRVGSAADWALARLDVALDQLRAKHEAAVTHAEQATRAAHHAEVTTERDALADELRERYPALAGELADLLTRVRASNERVEAVNRSGGPWIDPVETVARGIAPNGTDFLATWVRLPSFEREAHQMGQYLWPVPLNQPAALTADLAKASAAIGTEMRRVGELVAAKRAETNAARRGEPG